MKQTKHSKAFQSDLKRESVKLKKAFNTKDPALQECGQCDKDDGCLGKILTRVCQNTSWHFFSFSFSFSFFFKNPGHCLHQTRNPVLVDVSYRLINNDNDLFWIHFVFDVLVYMFCIFLIIGTSGLVVSLAVGARCIGVIALCCNI